MIKKTFGDRLDGWIHIAFPFLFRRAVDPNLLTVLGAIVSVAAAACFATGSLVAGGFVTLAGGFFDLVDGVVARHHGTSTRFGAFLDSTLDRLVDMALLLGLALYFAQAGRPGGVLLAGVALVATVLVSYSKACGERVVGPITVGILERGERVGLIAVGAIFGLVIPALWVVAIGSTITVGQRFAYAHREMTRMDAADSAVLGGASLMTSKEHDATGGGFTLGESKDSEGARDALPKVDFSTFVISLATSALYHMGIAGDPEQGEPPPKNLQLAQHTIDTLEMLAEKTQGNLGDEEAKLLKAVLYELHLRFVEARK